MRKLGERSKVKGVSQLGYALLPGLGVLASLWPSTISVAQKAEDFRKHVEFLAHDSLEGRMTGSEGEWISAEYIGWQLLENGARTPTQRCVIDVNNPEPPLGCPFEFSLGRKLGDGNTLVYDQNLALGSHYFPLDFSASTTARGLPLLIADTFDQRVSRRVIVAPWFELDPHSTTRQSPRDFASEMAGQGASAVIFFCDSSAVPPTMDYSRNVTPVEIPVVYITCEFGGLPQADDLKAGIGVDLQKIRGTGYNVAGLIDHKARYTVIIGAHYDHLGWGEHGSLYRGDSAIHNGADDNASGTAMLIELAEELRKKKYKKYNYLMVAFSGEELGLYGSSHFANNPPVDLSTVSYMINFDMVGRLDTSRGLAINGVGTSPVWPEVIKGIDSDMKIVTSESGVGPSDHTSFYLKNIPVLHFFTGAHEDYHKPTDDADKVNYDGMVTIMDYVLELIKATDASDTLPFTKTKDSNTNDAPRFSVTLGVVPDYLFDGVGMRISGVTDGKPASKAGLKEGDVVIKLGDYAIADMMSYMEGLARFKKGEMITVIVKRGNEELPFQVTF